MVPFSRARPPHLPGKPVPCTCGVPGSPVHTCEQRPGPMGFTSWAGTWGLQVRRVRQTKQIGLSSVTRRLEGDVSKATCSGGQSSILHQRERPHRVSDHRGRSCCQGSPSPGPCPAQIQPQQVTSPTPTWHSTPLCVGGGHGQGGLTRQLPRAGTEVRLEAQEPGHSRAPGAGRAEQGTGGRIPGSPGDLRVELRERGEAEHLLVFPRDLRHSCQSGSPGSPGKAGPAGPAPMSPPAAGQQSWRWDRRAGGHRPHPARPPAVCAELLGVKRGPQLG